MVVEPPRVLDRMGVTWTPSRPEAGPPTVPLWNKVRSFAAATRCISVERTRPGPHPRTGQRVAPVGAVNIARDIRRPLRSEPDAHEAASSEILRIRAALHHREHDGPHPVGASAVLAPLVPLASGLHVLFERRPPGSSFFSGHLSFPGGRMESRDPTPLAAALRETWEEVGIRPDTVEVLGHLDDARDPFGRRVSC